MWYDMTWPTEYKMYDCSFLNICSLCSGLKNNFSLQSTKLLKLTSFMRGIVIFFDNEWCRLYNNDRQEKCTNVFCVYRYTRQVLPVLHFCVWLMRFIILGFSTPPVLIIKPRSIHLSLFLLLCVCDFETSLQAWQLVRSYNLQNEK